MATTQMAQEFAGMPSRADATNAKAREPNLGLFLPGYISFVVMCMISFS